MEHKTDKAQGVTIKDISNRTGVSASAVSGILNDNPRCYAGEATREKVLAAASEMGYYPNLLYRGLRLNKTNTIGIIFPSFYYNFRSLDLEFFENLAWEAGYHVFIGYSGNSMVKEESLLYDFVCRRVDGIILIPGYSKGAREGIDKLLKQKFPLIIVGNIQGYEDAECSMISTNYYEGGALAARHLCDSGHSNLAVVIRTHFEKSQRIEGFINEAKSRGAEVSRYIDDPGDPGIDPGADNLIESGFKAGMSLLEPGSNVTGIFAHNDELAAGVVKAALKLGLDVPGDVSVVGFDNAPIARFSGIPLTTIKHQGSEISEFAFKKLMSIIKNGNSGKFKKKICPEIIERDSTAPLGNKPYSHRKPGNGENK